MGAMWPIPLNSCCPYFPTMADCVLSNCEVTYISFEASFVMYFITTIKNNRYMVCCVHLTRCLLQCKPQYVPCNSWRASLTTKEPCVSYAQGQSRERAGIPCFCLVMLWLQTYVIMFGLLCGFWVPNPSSYACKTNPYQLSPSYILNSSFCCTFICCKAMEGSEGRLL